MSKVINLSDIKIERAKKGILERLDINEIIDNWNPPKGAGKSGSIKKFAEENGIKLIDIKNNF